MARSEPFSFAGYSDAEWCCMMARRVGERTGFGQVIDTAHGKRLLDVLRRRCNDPRWITAVPGCLPDLPEFCDLQAQRFLERAGVRLEAHERDGVLDDCARKANLFPLINQLRRMRTVVVGNHALRPLKEQGVVDYAGFVGTSSPNLHLEPGGIEAAVHAALSLADGPTVYCVSAGVSAAVILDLLHDRLRDCWLLDVGSIWDAFVGIGGQRRWRQRLYASPNAMRRWREKCLTGR